MQPGGGSGEMSCHHHVIIIITVSHASSLPCHYYAMITVQGNRMAAASCHQYLDPVTAIVSIKDISKLSSDFKTLSLSCACSLIFQVDESYKVFRNEDCLKCSLGLGVSSLSCYNPYLRGQSPAPGKLFMLDTGLVSA